MENKWYVQEEVEKLYPSAIMIPPMKIGTFPGTRGITLHDVCNNGEYFAQLKKDGGCYIFEKVCGHCYLFGRTESKKTGLLTEKGDNVPHIVDYFNKFLPDNTILVGEIYYPQKTSKEMTTIMGCLPKKAIERQQRSGNIHYYIHDILMYSGEDLLDKGARVRYNYLLECFNNLESCGALPDFIELADIFEDTNLLEVASEALASGEEGIVLKKKDGTYQPGLRPAWQTIKIKKNATEDVICMGFENAKKDYDGKELDTWSYNLKRDGAPLSGNYRDLVREFGENEVIPVTKPYYYGWKGALVIGAYNEFGDLVQIGTVASGLNDFYRQSFAEEPNKYIGKVVEISFMEKFEGTFRHPTFERFRDDKNANECTLTEIFK